MPNTLNATILIVDDEKTNISYVSKILESYYSIKVAFNGEQALKILNKIPIDLILLDIQMPLMDGYQTIQEIKKNPKIATIPVIFLTSSKSDDTLVKVFKLGASDYISKPFNKEELKARVQNHIENYYLQQEIAIKNKQISSILNGQENIVLLSNGSEIEFVNKKFFEFFGYPSIEAFQKEHASILDLFISDEKFFHAGKVAEDSFWEESMMQLPQTQQIVKILSSQFAPHVFSVNINRYEKDNYITTFTDISDTILTQLELEEKIIHDPLTSSFNREYFTQNYKKLLKQYNTHQTHLAIAMLDLDKFKNVNDTYGHDVGDMVLVHFVNTLKKNLRKEDILIRWGGEEFILILKIDSQNTLDHILENLRFVVANEIFPSISTQTCSIGASVYKNNEDILATIKRADLGVYQAKEKGRNRVICIQ